MTEFNAESDISGLGNAVQPARCKRKGRPVSAVKQLLACQGLNGLLVQQCCNQKETPGSAGF